MRPFEIELWKAGEPVITRDGREVEQLTYFDNKQGTHKFVGIVNGQLNSWKDNGYFVDELCETEHDLFHPEPEMWVNVYEHNDSQWTTGKIMPSKEQAEERAQKDGSNTRYIGTFKLINP
jgi:hypothetical protein